jgi:hypothetical protein
VVSVRGRFDFCSSTTQNDVLRTHRREFSFSVTAEHTWDFQYVSPFVGAGFGINTVLQTFDTSGEAPARFSSAPLGFIVFGATLPLAGRSYVGADGQFATALVNYQETAFDTAQLRVRTSLRGTGFIGIQF